MNAEDAKVALRGAKGAVAVFAFNFVAFAFCFSQLLAVPLLTTAHSVETGITLCHALSSHWLSSVGSSHVRPGAIFLEAHPHSSRSSRSSGTAADARCSHCVRCTVLDGGQVCGR